MINYHININIIKEVMKILCQKYKSLDKEYLDTILQTNLIEQNINFHENEEENKLDIEQFEKKNKDNLNMDNKIKEIEEKIFENKKDNKEEKNNENNKDN